MLSVQLTRIRILRGKILIDQIELITSNHTAAPSVMRTQWRCSSIHMHINKNNALDGTSINSSACNLLYAFNNQTLIIIIVNHLAYRWCASSLIIPRTTVWLDTVSCKAIKCKNFLRIGKHK